MTTIVYILAGSTTYTLPADFGAPWSIQVYAPGGGGGSCGGNGASGGGGGGYSGLASSDGGAPTLTANTAYNCAVGSGGAGGTGAGNGAAGTGPAWFGGTNLATSYVGANAGAGGQGNGGTGGSGGSTTGAIGTIKHAGGNGGNGNGVNNGQAGGGGAAGPGGTGGVGGAATSATAGAGGGGGANTGGNGSNGATASGTTSGAGGAAGDGTGGGASVTGANAGNPGTNGSGGSGGGGTGSNVGGAGGPGNDSTLDSTHGPGGGGGCGGDSTNTSGNGGNGGLYGGGGGSSSYNLGTGGAGANGLIAIIYTPASTTPAWGWETPAFQPPALPRRFSAIPAITEPIPQYWYVPPKTITILSTGTFVVPADWNSANNSIQLWGPGGNSAAGTTTTAGAAGGSGGFSQNTNVALTPGASIPVAVGAAGSGAATTFNTSVIVANAGGNASGITGGSAAAAGTGGLARAGTAGAAGATLLVGGAGGTGAPGPVGLGAAGGAAAATDVGGNGGGGSDGGSVGVQSSGNNGGNGGNNALGAGGGTGGNFTGPVAPTPGTAGGGGGGGAGGASPAGAGAAGSAAASGAGSGGGGSGDSAASSQSGGVAGGFGASGGGGGRGTTAGGAPGASTGGAIVITYTPNSLQFQPYGWELAAPLIPHLRIEKAGGLVGGAPGVDGPLQGFQRYGWEIAPHQPPNPRQERGGIIPMGEQGTEAKFIPPPSPVNWAYDGLVLLRHPVPEKSGAMFGSAEAYPPLFTVGRTSFIVIANTGQTTVTLPPDFNGPWVLECIGGGSGGFYGNAVDIGVGGAGGQYARISSGDNGAPTLLPSQVLNIAVGTGGSGGVFSGSVAPGSGGATWIGGTNLATSYCGCPGAGAPTNGVAGTAPATLCIGTVKTAGGSGGGVGGNHNTGAGGGGAAGPGGTGGTGGTGGATIGNGGSSGGGGGNTGGSGGSGSGPAATAAGLAGGSAGNGTAGGSGGSSGNPGGAGSQGSGGGGGGTGAGGGVGGSGRDSSWAPAGILGPGGGGGAGGSSNQPGGGGGLYGGGGAGGSSNGDGGGGAQGVIVISYTPPWFPWMPFGWEIPAHQPQHPNREKAGALAWGDTGTEAAFVPPVAPITWAYEVPVFLPNALRRLGPAALFHGDDGIEAPAYVWQQFGWVFPPHQPGHPRPERWGSVAPSAPGIDAPFVPPPVPITWAYETSLFLPSNLRRLASAGVIGSDLGTQAPLLGFRAYGWEVPSFQPPHLRIERAGTLGWGDFGIEAPFIPPPTVVAQWGHEFTPTIRRLVRRMLPFWHDGIDVPLPIPHPQGWVIAPFQPPHPRRERAGVLGWGDQGTEAKFVPPIIIPATVYDIPPFQPRHPRPERAGAWMWGDAGIVFPFIPPINPIFPANNGGLLLVGDYRSGNVYLFNLNNMLDNGVQRRWLRTWRAFARPVDEPVRFSGLQIDMETGANVPAGTSPQVVLRWSDDGGHNFSYARIMAAGPIGATAQRVLFKRLGSTRLNSGLDRIFELSSTDPFKVALIGATLDPDT